MIFLIISILCSVAVSVLLKVARAKQMGLAPIVAVNYLVAISLTALFLKPNFANWQQNLLPSAWLFGLLGVLLPGVFIIMGRAVQSAGIVKSDAAQRLSLFLPVAAALTIFGETLVRHRAIGLVMAFAALLCVLYKPKNMPQKTKDHASWWLLGVLLGYGTIDILLKQLSRSNGTGTNLLLIFIIAAALMWIYLQANKIRLTRTDWLGGVLLGSLNFCNIFTYIQAHKEFSTSPTLVFAGMNMGVIILGTLVGALMFGERISRINAVGLLLALAAIWTLYFG